ncbi:Protein of unknown function [Alkalithermobacter thermoalcaliphilus JW-YL-7 = DSM 7308]|uniref:Putative Se/S carrier protein-like domain-containing protein n=1 Tax=Alkalithermobacter thermoalcaliphilus JW-YL-7 = DSM 7308 TaxID=1121328 RepID=A0A150FU92_CLOPD|nr:Protein of unknown function DUF3343 [[Clostridium] paradoxum JW-YL-7 = DSM 7308]SHL09096.1 Protein of unknown function [[Clostridium] paradoxum JW-YL-7 = DSM 7308]
MDTMYFISFNSTHHSMRLDKILRDNNINIKTIPTPREVTSSCGLSIVFNIEDLEKIKQKIEEFEIDYFGIFKMEKTKDGKRIITKL